MQAFGVGIVNTTLVPGAVKSPVSVKGITHKCHEHGAILLTVYMFKHVSTSWTDWSSLKVNSDWTLQIRDTNNCETNINSSGSFRHFSSS